MARQPLKSLERFAIVNPRVFGSSARGQPRVLRTNRRVIEASGNRMCRQDVAVVVLQHQAARAVQHARFAASAGLSPSEAAGMSLTEIAAAKFAHDTSTGDR